MPRTRNALPARRRRGPDGSPQSRAWLTISLAMALFALGAIAGRASRPSDPALPSAPHRDRRAREAGHAGHGPHPGRGRRRRHRVSRRAALERAHRRRAPQATSGALRRARQRRRVSTPICARTASACAKRSSAMPVVARPVPPRLPRRALYLRDARVVSVWGMALFGSGAYEPVTQWATSTLQLAWQRGAWKVAAMRSRPGPSPRWSIEELARDDGVLRPLPPCAVVASRSRWRSCS